MIREIDWRSDPAPEGSTPFRFTGQELDAETGLYYFGARYLDRGRVAGSALTRRCIREIIFLLRLNHREPAYQGIVQRQERNNVIVESTLNAASVIIDRIVYGGKYKEAANKFEVKVQLAFMETKSKATQMFQPDESGKYSKTDVSRFAAIVNNSMLLYHSAQGELGPYEGTINIPQISEFEANIYLNYPTPLSESLR